MGYPATPSLSASHNRNDWVQWRISFTGLFRNSFFCMGFGHITTFPLLPSVAYLCLTCSWRVSFCEYGFGRQISCVFCSSVFCVFPSLTFQRLFEYTFDGFPYSTRSLVNIMPRNRDPIVSCCFMSIKGHDFRDFSGRLLYRRALSPCSQKYRF